MVIDCGTCVMRDIACGDCMVSVLLGPPGLSVAGPVAPLALVATGAHPPVADPAAFGPAAVAVELHDSEWHALRTLADAGLVPPLRLVAGDE